MLALAPVLVQAASFADGVHYRPQIGGFVDCGEAAACVRPGPPLWEGVAGEGTAAAVMVLPVPGHEVPGARSQVPEAGTLGLTLAGLGLVALIALRRRTGRPVLPSLRFPL